MATFNQEINHTEQTNNLFATHFSPAFETLTSDEGISDSDAEVKRTISRTNTELVVEHNNGAISTAKGTGLSSSSNPLINEISVRYNNQIATYSGGSLSPFGSGSLNELSYLHTQTGVTMSGNIHYDGYTLTIYRLDFDSNEGFSFSFSGNISMSENDDDFTGYFNQFTVTINGKTDTFSDLNINYSVLASGEKSYSDFMDIVLSGDDQITMLAENDSVTGYEGEDTLVLPINTSDIYEVSRDSDGIITLRSSLGVDTLDQIENVSTLDRGTLSLDYLINTPTYSSPNSNLRPNVYEGPVTYLEFSLIGDESNEVIRGSDRNDFMNLAGGDDAADGGAGNDILDGGIGSNFLTGGTGDDVFYLDGRSTETTWSTVTDFNNDEVNIWGWQEGTSQILSTKAGGAEGFTGTTIHIDLDGDNVIDTSLTLTGISLAEMPEISANSIAGLGYLLIS